MAGSIAAVVVLNLLLTLHGTWQGYGVRLVVALSVDLSILILLMATVPPLRAYRARWWLTGLLLLLVIGRYADTLAPIVFGREVSLYWDLPHLPSVVSMLWAVTSTGRLVLIGGAVAAGLLVLSLVIRCCVGAVGAALDRRATRTGAAMTSAAVIAAFALSVMARGGEAVFARPVIAAFARQAATAIDGIIGPDAPLDLAANDAPLDPRSLCGADLMTLFVESYGVVVFDDPEMRRALHPNLAALAGAIADRGFGVVSARVTSPTFGGSSWLAHATLLTGVQVDDQGLYRRLMATKDLGLPSAMRRIGYRSVGLFPGLKSRWVEGAAYGFDKVYDAASLGYRGPDYGWWAIPDQFSLEALYRDELSVAPRKPLFVAGATIMSHLPFRPIPPYIADWSTFDAGGASLPAPGPADAADLRADYRRAIAYELRLLEGFIEQRAPRDLVFLILGDHQPLAAVSGEGASRDVPVHVVASRGEIGRLLEAAGFIPGLDLPRMTTGTMAQLNHQLRDLLARAPDCAQSSRPQ